jgi:zinc protease
MSNSTNNGPTSLGGTPNTAIPPKATVTTLPNGLTIIVREDHSAPVVSAQAWAMAGSIHEGRNLGAGMSHVLEHMLFKGTTTRPGSRIDQEVQSAGGYMNAYTSFDRTVFHIDVPNTGTAVAIDVLCDIMQHATLPLEELEKEKQVILREMDMNIDDPGRRASRRLFETAFTRSPYRFTVIGYPDLFHEVTQDDLKRYYHDKYAPNNVFFVVVGDVRTEAVLDMIRRGYAGAKARALPPEVLPAEPRQTAPRETTEEAPVEMGYLHMAWHIPDIRHPDVPALDIAAVLLGHGRSSRLYLEVRQKLGLVHSVDSWTYSPGSEGLFGLSATVDGPRYAEARAALCHEADRLRTDLVSEPEFAKALRQFTSAFLSMRKTMQGQAQDLGSSWVSANDLAFSERYLAAIRKTTREDIQRVAQKYLVEENRTIYALMPQGSTPTTTGVAVLTQQHPTQKFCLPNGMRLLVKEDRRLPFVEFRSVLQAGVLNESKTNNGVSQLMSKVLLKGTQSRSAEEISREIESVGGSIDAYSGNNSFGINAEVLKEDFQLGLDLVKDVLLNPSFNGDALERERQVQLAGIRAQRDHLLHEAFSAMRRVLFGEGGYGLDSLGSEESVTALKKEDIATFHQRQVLPENCVLAIYGDVDSATVLERVEKAFACWPTGSSVARTNHTAEHPVTKQKQRVTGCRNKKQAVVVIGYHGTSLSRPDRYALELLQEACSDLGSRLFLRIRDTLGLAYYVGAQNFVGITPGYFAFYAGTSMEHAEQVERELLAEAEELRNNGVTAEELARAKAKVIGQRKIARQDLGSQAMSHALDELHGLGFSYSDTEDALFEAVTGEQIIAAARRYLDPEELVISTILPSETASDEN